MKKLILLALLAVVMTGCRNGEVYKRNGDSCVVTEVNGCEYIMLRNAYGFQHKGNCKFCEERDSIKWEKRKAEIVELLKKNQWIELWQRNRY